MFHELEQEELTDRELRGILERLGQAEFGGSGLSRVGDVAEATGASSVAIGQILAEIRKEDWEKRFGARQDAVEAKVKEHGVRLDRHDTKLWKMEQRHEEAAAVPAVRSDKEIYEVVQREHLRRLRPVMVILAIAILAMLVSMVSTMNCDQPDPRAGKGVGFNGTEHRWQNGRWESRPEGASEPYRYDSRKSDEAEEMFQLGESNRSPR